MLNLTFSLLASQLATDNNYLDALMLLYDPVFYLFEYFSCLIVHF